MSEVKKARELDWDDSDKFITLLSGSEPVQSRVIIHRGQQVTVSDPLTGKVLTLSPEDSIHLDSTGAPRGGVIRHALAEEAIIERFGSLSSSAIRRILDAGATTIEERAADGAMD